MGGCLRGVGGVCKAAAPVNTGFIVEVVETGRSVVDDEVADKVDVGGVAVEPDASRNPLWAAFFAARMLRSYADPILRTELAKVKKPPLLVCCSLTEVFRLSASTPLIDCPLFVS